MEYLGVRGKTRDSNSQAYHWMDSSTRDQKTKATEHPDQAMELLAPPMERPRLPKLQGLLKGLHDQTTPVVLRILDPPMQSRCYLRPTWQLPDLR